MAMDSYTNEDYYEDNIPIESIEFVIFSNKDVKKYSVISKEDRFGIEYPETYDNNEPKRGGLVDLRLGTTESTRECATCGLRSSKCPGHFGHIELSEPVFHPGFKDIIKGTLGCICLKCSALLIPKTSELLDDVFKSKSYKIRYDEIRKLTGNIRNCHNCNAPTAKVKLETRNTVLQFVAEISSTEEENGQAEAVEGQEKKKLKYVMTPAMIYDIFTNISNEDCELLGFNHKKCRPEKMILKFFPIPPVAIRPSVKADFLTSGSAEDTMNNKLADIVKANIRMRKYKDKGNITDEDLKYKADYQQWMQYNIGSFFDNDSGQARSELKSSGHPVKSIVERIKGKQGRIRNNLNGKRVDYCARSVITSDPNLSLDELGVPIKIAMNVTFPEVVREYNIKRLTKLVNNGRNVYPGANSVITKRAGSNKTFEIDLRYAKNSIELKYGDIVKRHIMNGDPVLFNRQPTLHKMSMMSHIAKVINNDKLSTFRINVSVTTPYNADTSPYN